MMALSKKRRLLWARRRRSGRRSFLLASCVSGRSVEVYGLDKEVELGSKKEMLNRPIGPSRASQWTKGHLAPQPSLRTNSNPMC
jgi:hypothetical protein